MKQAIVFLVTLLSISFVFSDIQNELDSIQGQMPGCGLGVVSKGELVLEEYAGYSSLKYEVPITEDTLFNIGSINKHMTAAVLFRLEQQSVLNRNDVLRDFYPNSPEWLQDITLENLVQHTSGLPDFLNDERFSMLLLRKLTSDQETAINFVYGIPIAHEVIVEVVLEGLYEQSSPMFTPGSEMSYSNTGYLLLADIIERKTQRSLVHWLNEFIFEPYEMNNTSVYEDSSKDLYGLATGYGVSPHRGQNYHSLLESLASHGEGGVITSIKDFAKWIKVLNNAKSPDSIWYGFLIDPLADDNKAGVSWYQNGLEIENYKGLVYYHSGASIDNMHSDFWVAPEHNLGYVRLCNFEYFKRYRKVEVFNYVTN